MMGFENRHPDRPFPELLAAYADGELDAEGRARVEAWLAAHPKARPALESQRRLSRRNRKLWRAAAAPAPNERNWDRVFGRMQEVLNSPAEPVPVSAPRRFRPWRYLIPAVSTAAAAVTLFLARSTNIPTPAPLPRPRAAENALVMATAADVDIISLDNQDAAAVVVGQLPLTGTVVLAASGDVELKNVQKDSDGMVPRAQMNDAGLAPMIIAPIAGR
jgi:anti-sigma factor RsiW